MAKPTLTVSRSRTEANESPSFLRQVAEAQRRRALVALPAQLQQLTADAARLNESVARLAAEIIALMRATQ